MGLFLSKRNPILKITHVISDSNIGGAGVLLSSVVEKLKDDFEFEIIIPRGSALKKKLELIGADIKEFDFSPDLSFSLYDTLMFFNYFKKNPTDILHTHASLSARLGGKLSGTKACISTRHCAKSEEKVKKQSIFKRLLYNYCTDKTVSTADYAKNNLRDEGYGKNRIITIKNGSFPKEKLCGSTKRELLSALGISEDCRIIGSCARLEAVKGQDLILRAAPHIIKAFPNVHFLFIGDGSQKENYKRLASALGIEKKTTFLGYKERPEAYQSLFYVNVNSSRGTETSCLATSECMALSIPTVASDFGGNTEMIKNLENGLLFGSDNPYLLANAIIRLLCDDRLYKKLSDGAKRSFDGQFSADRMAAQYKELYLSFSNLQRSKSLR